MHFQHRLQLLHLSHQLQLHTHMGWSPKDRSLCMKQVVNISWHMCVCVYKRWSDICREQSCKKNECKFLILFQIFNMTDTFHIDKAEKMTGCLTYLFKNDKPSVTFTLMPLLKLMKWSCRSRSPAVNCQFFWSILHTQYKVYQN